MKKELSILIPVFNYDCTALVDGLSRQSAALQAEGVRVEIIVAEDGSTNEAALHANAALTANPLCRYLPRRENVGRAAIRNYLAQQANMEWLLFLDCDMQLPDDRFLLNYLNSEGDEVIDGGFAVCPCPEQMGRNLRYSYEWSEMSHHGVAQRQANPYRSFRTTNFMIRRDIILAHPFDERFRHYGYEDVLFGKELHRHGIAISHIDNAMMLSDLETNDVFVSKTEEALRTLRRFRDDLRGYSQLLTVVDGIHIAPVRWLIRLWHRLFGWLERRNLCGRHPSLRIFKLYKLGYYLTLTKNDNQS